MNHPSPRPNRDSGFTIIELLTAMTVLAVIMVLTVQMIAYTSKSIDASSNQMDCASMSRIALERMGRDLSGAVISGGGTVLYATGSGGNSLGPQDNSAFSFVTKSKARGNSNATLRQDVRGLLVGYKIRDTAISGGPTLQTLVRGDAAFTYLNASTGSSQGGINYGFNIWSIFGAASNRSMVSDLTAPVGGDQTLLKWEGQADGIIRLHVSFLLSDGRTVQLPPAYYDFQANGNTGSCLPVPFSPETSADPNRLYVKGLIVGIVAMDAATQSLAYDQDPNYGSTLAKQLGRPQNDGETPLAVWQGNLSKVDFLPVRQNVRFYQRFFPLSL